LGCHTNFYGLDIHVHISPCAHTCRYCSIGDRTFSSISATRLIALYDRFRNWKLKKGIDEFQVQWAHLGPSFNFDVATLMELTEHSRRCGDQWRRIPLGGLKMLPKNEMQEWLEARQMLGYDSISASMAGHGEIHDHWNGRQGDFSFMLSTQEIAVKLGMELHQGFFLAKSTLPVLNETIELLNSKLGSPAKRYVRSIMYAGYGSHREEERITEEDWEHIPEWVLDIFKRDSQYLRSEREWIMFIRKGDYPRRENSLNLYVDDRNIDKIEARTCDEILDDLENRTSDVLSVIPSMEELCEIAGDCNGTKLYDNSFDLHRAWMDRYLDKHPLDVDWGLIPYHVGKPVSRHPIQF
jgi:hypothetical protein